MKNEKVYLTFETDRITSAILKKIANTMGKTQPELINDLCKAFVEDTMSNVYQALEEVMPDGNCEDN